MPISTWNPVCNFHASLQYEALVLLHHIKSSFRYHSKPFFVVTEMGCSSPQAHMQFPFILEEKIMQAYIVVVFVNHFSLIFRCGKLQVVQTTIESWFRIGAQSFPTFCTVAAIMQPLGRRQTFSYLEKAFMTTLPPQDISHDLFSQLHQC